VEQVRTIEDVDKDEKHFWDRVQHPKFKFSRRKK
jgi:hypothetical protein